MWRILDLKTPIKLEQNRRLETITPDQLQEAAKMLIEAYLNDLDNSLYDELLQFSTFTEIFKDKEEESISTEHFLYKLM